VAQFDLECDSQGGAGRHAGAAAARGSLRGTRVDSTSRLGRRQRIRILAYGAGADMRDTLTRC
jgi:hypothetical protein